MSENHSTYVEEIESASTTLALMAALMVTVSLTDSWELTTAKDPYRTFQAYACAHPEFRRFVVRTIEQDSPAVNLTLDLGEDKAFDAKAAFLSAEHDIPNANLDLALSACWLDDSFIAAARMLYHEFTNLEKMYAWTRLHSEATYNTASYLTSPEVLASWAIVLLMISLLIGVFVIIQLSISPTQGSATSPCSRRALYGIRCSCGDSSRSQ